VLHQIGIGTLGPVFRTYEPTRDRLVAVKAFRLDIVPEQAQTLAAALSRAAQASLFHPSIVEPIEAGVEGTLAYRAEEYVAAESLDVAMRHYAPAPIDKVLPFITQLAGAIDFARAAGIGHGGLHPRDIFVTPDEARATGFGVVEALEQVGIRAPVRRPYSAPERIDGTTWGTAADVFSLAAITFELLTGKRPAGTGAQIGSLPDGKHAAAVHTVLARAMADDPAKRYASALAFAGALEAASQGRRPTDAVTVLGARLNESPVGAASVPGPPVPVPAVAASTAVVPAAVSDQDSDDRGTDDFGAETPGEFEIEAALDPVHEAVQDSASHRDVAPAVVPTLFDAVPDDEVDRFSAIDEPDDEPDADRLSPLEDEPPHATPAPIPAEAPMFRSVNPDLEDGADRSRPVLLPYAIVGLLMLLVGFGAGYFMRGRVALEPQEQPPAAAAGTATPAAAGAATAEKPGQYSEQKVTSAAAGARPSAPATVAPAPAVAPAPRPREAAATKGQIVVRSLPSHAGVTINGRWRGRTPLTLDDMAFGPYTVRVVQPGYEVARDEFTLDARTPARTITTRLERLSRVATPPVTVPGPGPAPASYSGSLYVDSRPRGAKVLIDGRDVGQTPLSLPDLAAGSHLVRIEMDGKKPVTATPRVVAGKMERVTVSLEDK
jgi:serine/threonine protein kinase